MHYLEELYIVRPRLNNILEKPNSCLNEQHCGEKTPLLTWRNLQQNQSQCGQLSASIS